MDNILIFSDYLILLGTPMEIKSFYLSEITLTEGSKVSRQFAYFLHTKLSFQIISICLEAITSASLSTGCMVFMMNAKGGMVSKSGRTLVSASMCSLYPLLLMIEFYACMEVLAPI